MILQTVCWMQQVYFYSHFLGHSSFQCVSFLGGVSAEVMVKVHVVDLKNDTIVPPVSVRAFLNQSIAEFKQLIAQVAVVLFPLSQ
jgi:hypothetical protein